MDLFLKLSTRLVKACRAHEVNWSLADAKREGGAQRRRKARYSKRADKVQGAEGQLLFLRATYLYYMSSTHDMAGFRETQFCSKHIRQHRSQYPRVLHKI